MTTLWWRQILHIILFRHDLQIWYCVSKLFNTFKIWLVKDVPTQTFILHSALVDRNMQVRFGLKVFWEFWIAEFLLMSLWFGQKWHPCPPQPPTLRVPKINKIVSFWWSIPHEKSFWSKGWWNHQAH